MQPTKRRSRFERKARRQSTPKGPAQPPTGRHQSTRAILREQRRASHVETVAISRHEARFIINVTDYDPSKHYRSRVYVTRWNPCTDRRGRPDFHPVLMYDPAAR